MKKNIKIISIVCLWVLLFNIIIEISFKLMNIDDTLLFILGVILFFINIPNTIFAYKLINKLTKK